MDDKQRQRLKDVLLTVTTTMPVLQRRAEAAEAAEKVFFRLSVVDAFAILDVLSFVDRLAHTELANTDSAVPPNPRRSSNAKE